MDNAGVILCQDLNREVTEALNLCAPDKLFIPTLISLQHS